MLSVSCTTRPPRPGECRGRDYHFVSPARFADMVRDGAFLEYAEVFGHSYGTCRQWVEEQLAGGHSVVLEIDWQGAAQVKSLAPDCCAIFILPPGLQTLAERLRTRGEDSPEVIEHRLAEARADMQRYKSADFLVINADFDNALDRLCDIFQGRIAPTPIEQQAKRLITDTNH